MTKQELDDMIEWKFYIKLKAMNVRKGELSYLDLAKIEIDILKEIILDERAGLSEKDCQSSRS